ncbi:thioredoxin family protein [Membranihabitans maritimus]|uniref:thioredoxin family protein n=1 Tax=Membranihabitans maritimus TaxID=2904244 RepID=UPI001F1F25F0|nr:thioredoxin fold domain-containing protein [Membranihabitans maritimus]
MISKIINISLVFSVFISPIWSQNQSDIHWMDIEDALRLQKVEQKKILVEVYTDWCKVCHKLDQISLSQPQIANYINEFYYPVKFNAECEKTVYFRGKKYGFVETANSGYHEFAYKITHGKLNYPSLVFLDKDLSVIQPISGFQGPDKLMKVLIYFAENYNKTTPWNDFNAKYNSMIYNSSVGSNN